MKIQVVLCQRELKPGEMDLLEYLKRKGERMLAVKVVKFRKEQIKSVHFMEELQDLIEDNDDILVYP